jgi:prolipoprotein diacylglyceryltransferase
MNYFLKGKSVSRAHAAWISGLVVYGAHAGGGVVGALAARRCRVQFLAVMAR